MDTARSRIERAVEGLDLASGPLSPEEYETLQLRRRTGYTPEPDHDDHRRFVELSGRYCVHLGTTDEGDAWHEAGHPVVADALGYAVQATFRYEDGSPAAAIDGITHEMPNAEDEQTFLDLLHDWALIQVAGYLAERKAMGHSDPVEATRIARRLGSRFGYSPSARLAYLDAIESEAMALLERRWDAVGRVSRMLHSEMHRSRDELVGALQGADFE